MTRMTQRGAALLTALVVVALAVIIASAMLWDAHLGQRRTANILFGDQALLYGLAAEDWAAQILRRDRAETETDHLGEAWATPLTGLPIDGGQLGGQLEDLQGRFNLNNLVDSQGVSRPDYVAQFRRLLDALGITAPIQDAIVDWLDADQEPASLNGAEDGHYLRKTPAHRTANRAMSSVSELRLVEGVTPEIYAALEPYVTVLPVYGIAGVDSPTRINVNTAPAPVLMSLSSGIDGALAENLVTLREERPFDSPTDFQGQLGGVQVQANLVTIESYYFRLRSDVAIGTVTLSMYSLLARQGDGSTYPLARSLGEL